MQLHSKSYGDAGPALVILHGLLGAGGNWHSLSSRVFSEHFRTFAVDLRNHGRSPHDDVFDYPSMVADVVEFLDANGLERAHVLGHSMGGKAAMHLALTHAARVDGLVVADMAPRAYPAHHEGIFAALRAVDPADFTSRADIDAALAEHVPNTGVRLFLMKNLTYDPDTQTYAWGMNLDAVHRNYPRINEPVETERPYAGPALFVRGERSDYVRDDDLPTIRRLFPRAEVVTIPKAGHWLHAEAPEPFGRAVTDFLTGLPAG